MRKLRLKIIAIFLLLVFSQKLGLRLWMHHWFHEAKTLQISHVPFTEKIQLGCDCFDDAMMPLTESPVITVSIPFQTSILLTAGYHPPYSAADKLFYSLKGPPAASI